MLICAATIDAVKDDQIHVTFDGWARYDYWTRYDSRDIFPVNWCKRSGHPMQPPGTNDSTSNKRKSAKHTNVSTSSTTEANNNKKLPVDDSVSTSPVILHFHAKCRSGRLIDVTKLRPMVSAPTYQQVALSCLYEILTNSNDTPKLLEHLSSLDGVEHTVGKNYPVQRFMALRCYVMHS